MGCRMHRKGRRDDMVQKRRYCFRPFKWKRKISFLHAFNTFMRLGYKKHFFAFKCNCARWQRSSRFGFDFMTAYTQNVLRNIFTLSLPSFAYIFCPYAARILYLINAIHRTIKNKDKGLHNNPVKMQYFTLLQFFFRQLQIHGYAPACSVMKGKSFVIVKKWL